MGRVADGSRQRPIMIHRALFGSVERFIGVLVEHYAGAFPPWLAPVQVIAIPVASEHNDYLQRVAELLKAEFRETRRHAAPPTGCRKRSAMQSGSRSHTS